MLPVARRFTATRGRLLQLESRLQQRRKAQSRYVGVHGISSDIRIDDSASRDCSGSLFDTERKPGNVHPT